MNLTAWEEYKSLDADAILGELLQEEIEAIDQRKGKTGSLFAARKRQFYTFLFGIALICLLLLRNIGGACLLMLAYAVILNMDEHFRMKHLKQTAKLTPDRELAQIVEDDSYIVEEKVFPLYNNVVLAGILVLSIALTGVSASGFFSTASFMHAFDATQRYAGKELFYTGTKGNGLYAWTTTDEGCMLAYFSGGIASKAHIPAEVNGSPVVAIAERAFENETFLRSITMADTVKEIGSYAFKGCTALNSVELSESLLALGGESFRDCTSLTSITIPSGVTEIRGDTFRNCKNLQTVALHDRITAIHAYAFYGCSALQHISLPDSITEIRANTFEHCSSLSSITIPEGVTRIAAHAFYGCSRLSSVSLPSTLGSIGSSAFRKCDSLNYITIPYNCSVHERAFKDSPTKVTRSSRRW